MAQRRGGRWLVLLIGLVVLIVVVWLGTWYGAHAVAERTLARMTGSHANGQQITCADAVLAGFPLRLDLTCSRGAYAGPAESVTAAIGGVRASAPLYVPGTAEAEIDGPLTVNDPSRNVALTASWSAARAKASAWIGGLTGAGATFASLKAVNTGAIPNIPIAAASADTASAAIEPAGGGSFAFVGDAKNLVLTRSDGSALPALDADARITALNVGAGLGTDPARTLRSWLKRGGAFKIDNVRLAADGAVLSGNGTMNVAKDGSLSGSVVLRFTNLDALVNLADQIAPGHHDKAMTAVQAITALSVPVDTPDGPARQTTLSIINGMPIVGIVPVPIMLPRVKL
jgi:hypothetical protein